MARASEGGRGFDWLWFLAWGVLSTVWCVTAAGQLGATFDEPGDLSYGLDFWRTGSHHLLMKMGAMPLPMDLDTLPLYIWERWHGVPLDLAHGTQDWPLLWARAGTLVFWWLLLIYGRLAGRALAGPWGGRLAVALLACEPSLLAHACLATKDIAVSACLLALVYYFRTGREAPWRRRVGWPGFWFGAALLAKASALAFAPLCLVAVELERLARAGAFQRARQPDGTASPLRAWLGNSIAQLFRMRWDYVQIASIGFALMFLYCGCDWCVQPSFVAWAHQLPDGLAGRSMVWLAEHLTIFSNAGEGLVRQIAHNMRGHGSYLLGETDRRALWYYFPVALTMKLSVPLLALPLLLAVLRPRVLANWACVAAAVLLVYSLNCRVQIGIRLLLPLVVLGVVGLAAGVAQAWQQLPPGWRRRLVANGAAAGIAWTAVAAGLVWPNGLCYVNELWGGTQRGYLCLSDSNYDWGQGLKELARWQQQHGVADLNVWYFGSDPALTALPVHHLPLHVLPLGGPEDVRAQVRGHYLAVSTTLLYGTLLDTPGHQQAVDFLRQCQPVARTSTFLIYDFTADDASYPCQSARQEGTGRPEDSPAWHNRVLPYPRAHPLCPQGSHN